jgi:hypothetical protein
MDNDTNQIVLPPDTPEPGNNKQQPASNKIKDPEDWTTGDEPMTGAQRSYLQTLSELHGEDFDENLTKAQAAELIDSKKQNITVQPPYDASDNFWNTAIKDPDDWKTGDEPATGAQLSYLKTLASEAGESIDENISKAEASKRIDALQQKTGRGKK